MSFTPRFQLKVSKLRRQGAMAFWGWRWQWTVRIWVDDLEGYFPIDLFGWRGQCRSREQAIANANMALDRWRAKQAQAMEEETVWHYDE